jgi:hypothetical protein
MQTLLRRGAATGGNETGLPSDADVEASVIASHACSVTTVAGRIDDYAARRVISFNIARP